LKSIEELVTAIAMMHNIIRAEGGEVIPTCQYRCGGNILVGVLTDICRTRVAGAYRKLWKLEGWPASARHRFLYNRFYT
jgi:hypothetical protein